MDMEAQMREVIRVLDALPSFLLRQRKEIIEAAAVPIVQAAKAAAPVSTKVHFSYNTSKLDPGTRAPKGMGTKTGTFNPGNLRDSIQILKHGKFRRSQNVFVGPKLNTRASTGNRIYGGGRKSVNGYYAHWLEFGTVFMEKKPYMRPGFDRGKLAALAILKRGVAKAVNEFGQKHKVA